MSTQTCAISGSVMLASVTHLYQPSEPPLEVAGLEAGGRGHPRHHRVEHQRRDDEIAAADEIAKRFQNVSPVSRHFFRPALVMTSVQRLFSSSM